MQLSIFLAGKGNSPKIDKMIFSLDKGKKSYRIYTAESSLYNHCGDDSREDPPVLIPNTEVKLSYAEST